MWTLHHMDCIEFMAAAEPQQFDFSVFSPPFPSLYAYTSEPGDIGNSEDLAGEMKLHLSFFYRGLAKVLKPGRVALVHVMQIPRMKRAGGQGLFDFRGFNIRLAERAGLIYEYDWLIPKNPQAQAIRTKSREMQFAGLERDRSRCRGALGDYMIKFVAPGDNAVAIDDKGQVSRNDWIEWAEAAWWNIKETDTLNVAEGRDENDTKHICPLQRPIVRRAVRLFSREGETVFSPFTGIGTEGYESIRAGRRFVGCELKDSYFAAAKKNLAKAEHEFNQDAETRLF